MADTFGEEIMQVSLAISEGSLTASANKIDALFAPRSMDVEFDIRKLSGELETQIRLMEPKLKSVLSSLTRGMSGNELFRSMGDIKNQIFSRFLPEDASKSETRALRSALDKMVTSYFDSVASAMSAGVNTGLEKRVTSFGTEPRKLAGRLKANVDSVRKLIADVETVASHAASEFGKVVGATSAIQIPIGQTSITRDSLKGRLRSLGKKADTRLKLLADVTTVAFAEAEKNLAEGLLSRDPAIRSQAYGQLPSAVISKAKEIAGSKLFTLAGGKENTQSFGAFTKFVGDMSAARSQQMKAVSDQAEGEAKILQDYHARQYREFRSQGMLPRAAFQAATMSTAAAATEASVSPERVAGAIQSSPLTARVSKRVHDTESRNAGIRARNEARRLASDVANSIKEGRLDDAAAAQAASLELISGSADPEGGRAAFEERLRKQAVSKVKFQKPPKPPVIPPSSFMKSTSSDIGIRDELLGPSSQKFFEDENKRYQEWLKEASKRNQHPTAVLVDSAGNVLGVQKPSRDALGRRVVGSDSTENRIRDERLRRLAEMRAADEDRSAKNWSMIRKSQANADANRSRLVDGDDNQRYQQWLREAAERNRQPTAVLVDSSGAVLGIQKPQRDVYGRRFDLADIPGAPEPPIQDESERYQQWLRDAHERSPEARLRRLAAMRAADEARSAGSWDRIRKNQANADANRAMLPSSFLSATADVVGPANTEMLGPNRLLPNDREIRRTAMRQLKAAADSQGVALAARGDGDLVRDAVNAASRATVTILEAEGMTVAAARAEVDRLRPDMLKRQQQLVRSAKGMLSGFSKNEIQKRFEGRIDDQRLSGMPAAAEGVRVRDELFAELDRQLPPGARIDANVNELYEQLRTRIARQSSQYTGPLDQVAEEEQIRQQEIHQRLRGNLVGRVESPEATRNAMRQVIADLGAEVTVYETRLAAATPGTDAWRQINRELQAANTNLVSIRASEATIVGLADREAEIRQNIAGLRARAAANPGMIEGFRIRRDLAAEERRLQRTQQERRAAEGGGTGNPRDFNFAIMQAAYGLEDFMQVLAQPGMGVSRAFLAAANNIGPALGAIGVTSVHASIGIAAVMGAMSLANIVMSDEEDRLKGVKDAVNDLANSYRKMYEERLNLQRGLSAIGGTIGQGTSQAQKNILGQPLLAEPLNYLLQTSRIEAGHALGQDLGPGFNRSKSFQGFDLTALPKMLGNPFVLAYQAMSTQRNLNVPLNETERMFPVVGNYTEFMTSMSDEDRKKFFKGRGLATGLLDMTFGFTKQKYDRTANRLAAEDKAMTESGAKARYMETLRSLEEQKNLLNEIERTIPGSSDRMVLGGKRASEMDLMFPGSGLREAYAKSAFENIRLSRERSLEAQNQLDLANENYPDKIARKRAARSRLQDELASSADIERSQQLKFDIAEATREIVVMEGEFEKIKRTAEVSAKLAAQAAPDFEALAKLPGFGILAAKQLIPGLDQGGLIASREQSNVVRDGIREFEKLLAGMNELDKAFFEGRASILQFGTDFAGQMAKIETITSELKMFQATNNGNIGRLQNAGISSAIDVGKALGFELKPQGRQEEMLARQQSAMERFINDLERRAVINGDVAGNLRAGVQAERVRREMDFMNNNPLLQKVNSANEFAIAVLNLGRAIEQGAALAKEGGLMTEQQGAWVALNAQLKAAGFNTKTLADELKIITDNEAMIVSQIRADKTLSDDQKDRQVELVQRQSQVKRDLLEFSSAAAQAQRQARGGFLDRQVYLDPVTGQKKSGRQMNLDAELRNLREERDKALAAAKAENDPKLRSIQEAAINELFNKQMAKSIDQLIPPTQGKTMVEGIEGLHRSIQESLTNETDPALRLEQDQVKLLTEIRDVLTGKKQPGEVSQKARDFLEDQHKATDDLPRGGAAGMDNPELTKIQEEQNRKNEEARKALLPKQEEEIVQDWEDAIKKRDEANKRFSDAKKHEESAHDDVVKALRRAAPEEEILALRQKASDATEARKKANLERLDAKELVYDFQNQNGGMSLEEFQSRSDERLQQRIAEEESQKESLFFDEGRPTAGIFRGPGDNGSEGSSPVRFQDEKTALAIAKMQSELVAKMDKHTEIWTEIQRDGIPQRLA